MHLIHSAAVVATNSSSAADTAAATIEAKNAAQKAKDASVAARSKASAEALISGDGEQVISVLSNCFSDPKYGLRKQEKLRQHEDDNKGSDKEDESIQKGNDEDKDHSGRRRDSSVVAYLYLDGDVYFRLDLIAPYLGVVSSKITVPPPAQGTEGRGDAIDWMIFMVIMAFTLFGALVMLHQVGFVIDKRLRFRNIFHPNRADEDDCGLEEEPLKLGGGFAHSELRMTVESIPTSMGGNGESSYTESSDAHNGIDLELADIKSQNNGTPIQSPSPNKARITSDVDYPTLKSSSKVASKSIHLFFSFLILAHCFFDYHQSFIFIVPQQSPNSPLATVKNDAKRLKFNNELPELPLE